MGSAMNSASNTHIRKHGAGSRKPVPASCLLPPASSPQRGGASPFMFGLLMGMTIFSAFSLQWAQRELVASQQRQAEKAKREAEDLVKALEFAAMTETRNTYSDDFDLERARRYTAMSSGKTRGGQDFIVVQQEDKDKETFGETSQKVAITASDDTLLRSKVYRTGDAKGVDALSGDTVATLDTAGVRQRQILTSVKSMENLAEQVYAFYAGNRRFPKSNEFDVMRNQLSFGDAWGGPFAYTYISDDEARLEFTTPWNYTHSLKLTLKEE